MTATNSREGRITDDGIAFMRSQLQVEYLVRPWNSVATRDAIWHFAQGVGDDNPLWWDPSYAAESSAGRMFAPPTFLYTCANGGRRLGDSIRRGVEDFLPGVSGMWANDRWVWHRPTWVDTKVEARTALWDVQEKQSSFAGRAVVQTERTTFEDAGTKELLAECYRTILRFERAAARQKGKYAGRERPRYSAADLEEIHAQYECELMARRGAQPRCWEDVEVGDSLGTLVKGPLTLTNIVGWLLGWGSPLCQTNRIAHRYLQEHPGARLFDEARGIEDTLEGAHWDPHFAQQTGMADGYDFGAQRFSWIAHLLTDWCGDDGVLSEMHLHLRRPNYLFSTTWITGSVTAKRETDHGHLVDCEVAATNELGEVTTTGTASIRLPTGR